VGKRKVKGFMIAKKKKKQKQNDSSHRWEREVKEMSPFGGDRGGRGGGLPWHKNKREG